ncbi:CDP-diacylglycerol--serine O-phosphatidyltransferase [Gallibacterium sp. AGMB14963]|uniref:CDP-diacylglycerol--serine O-phosphatidyltransferase n=1 Tax=Gallibacterium faecale TaxID=3019086 RepID=UPI0022F19FCE|nr:CDP-diacylglycerol--serine O-phosphatidyltransferase [Gallibacterium sp. AGMB14963]MDA3978699.1 CDP-diacylglycerol--serine O-phosphatidyltransferase [Gallibacterium sp. AGMB14963]
MLLSRLERAKRRLSRLPAFDLTEQQLEILPSAKAFKQQILQLIEQAEKRIYITALYWEKDEAGQEILEAVYRAKQKHPELDVKIFVDWHRAQRGRIGEEQSNSNADWYATMRQKYGFDDVIFYGVPINTREIFGVLHIKGFVFDDTVLYSGASINNVYLHQQDRYRYDRYQVITHPQLADCLVEFIEQHLNDISAVNRLDQARKSTRELRPTIRSFRKKLMLTGKYNSRTSQRLAADKMTITPLFGLGKNNLLNKVIEALFLVTQKKLTICTPYFNFPRSLQHRIRTLLHEGKKVEIIVGDKTANDFYIPPSEPFKLAGALPYLYEKNLRQFTKRFAEFIENKQLTIRLWKDGENSYHLKGVWVDDNYILLTGNNLNPRAWRLDAENGLLIHDPEHQITEKTCTELAMIRTHTTLVTDYQQLEKPSNYPAPAQRVLRRFERIKADHLVKMIL